MNRLPTSEARATVVSRTLDFLREAHRMIAGKENATPCMLYSAMTHHLGWDTMNAAVRLGIIRREGWRWHWMLDGRPNKKLAQAVYEERRRLAVEGGLLSPNAAARIRNKVLNK